MEVLRRHADKVLAVAVAVLYVMELLIWEATDRRVAIPLAIFASGMLALRRVQPLVAFTLCMTANAAVLLYAPGFDNHSSSFVIVFVIALYSLGRHAHGAEAGLGLLGVLVTIVVFVWADGVRDVGAVVFATAICGLPWAAGLILRLRRAREAELTARNESLLRDREENARRAVTAERARIAREMHDVVSHAISVTVLQARGARRVLGSEDTDVRRALDAIERTNTAALGDMRRLLAVLRDTDGPPDDRLAPQPTLASLDRLVTQVRASGLHIHVEATGDPGLVSPGVDLSAYRIIQEALTNALKHAGPQATATVMLSYGTDELAVEVTNTGDPSACGPPAAGAHDNSGTAVGGNGLIGIRERVAVVGGSVQVGPVTGGGFTVRALLPYSVRP